jgi:hypothetical protein
MSELRVIVVSAEEAYDGTAEFWCGGELMGVTMLSPSGVPGCCQSPLRRPGPLRRRAVGWSGGRPARGRPPDAVTGEPGGPAALRVLPRSPG